MSNILSKAIKLMTSIGKRNTLTGGADQEIEIIRGMTHTSMIVAIRKTGSMIGQRPITMKIGIITSTGTTIDTKMKNTTSLENTHLKRKVLQKLQVLVKMSLKTQMVVPTEPKMLITLNIRLARELETTK